MSDTFVTSHGTTFTFKSNTYKCLNIALAGSAPSRERLDMTTLDVADGAEAVMVLAPIVPKRDPKTFAITYRTMSNSVAIVEGDSGTLTTADGTGTYRVTAIGATRQVNQYIEGSATFEEVIAGEVQASGS